jgi:uncharacterized protein (DUF736 family)|tara:strand:- start:12242 stop:12481 length:240 start_codon:yes stop_codon:yes gene_type:complete
MSDTTNKSEWKEREIGAFWKRESPNQKFLSGKIEIEGKKLEVVLFSNRFKEKDNQPDYRLYLSADKQSKPEVSAQEELV